MTNSITGYVILRRNRDTDEEGHFDELVADTGSAATTYTDDTVADDTRYTYRIKAINAYGVSERSHWLHVATPAAEPPAQPTGLTARRRPRDGVILIWADPGDDTITGYVILRRVRVNDQGGEFSELVPDTGTAATTYTDDTVAASTTYTYRIKAINAHGVSERSHWFHVETPAAPDGERVQPPAAPQQVLSAAGHDNRTALLDRPAGRQHHRLPHPARRRRGRGAGRVRRPQRGHGQCGLPATPTTRWSRRRPTCTGCWPSTPAG